MKLNELKKAQPATMKSSGTDDPKKYVGGWEVYDEPQGINDRQDRKVLAKEDVTKRNEENNFAESSYGSSVPTRAAAEPNDPEISISDVDKKQIKASSKPPKKQIRMNVRAMSARGKPPQLNPYKLHETVRSVITGTLNAEYEIVDEEQKSIGYAAVVEGVISALDYDTDAVQTYRTQILSALLSDIVTDADHKNANLVVDLAENDSEIKSVLERFGFRIVDGDTMTRNNNSVRPISVDAPQGMVNREE